MSGCKGLIDKKVTKRKIVSLAIKIMGCMYKLILYREKIYSLYFIEFSIKLGNRDSISINYIKIELMM